ncbi:MAG: DUF1302 family protein [Pseudomonadota bacterium]
MKHLQQSTQGGLPRTAIAAALALALGCTGQALAFEFPSGNEDLSLRWDNSVRYNLGMRMEGQDRRILNSASYDESDAKFGKHDIVTNRIDLLSEFDLNYKRLAGFRVSAAGWFDQAYHDSSVTAPAPGGVPSSYYNNRYNHKVDRYVNGPSGELLDAFVWTNIKLGDVPVNVKVGRHTNIWGEGLLIGAHAISYGQAPIDGVKAVTSPGIETKELFLPIGQLSAKAQVTEQLALAMQYFYEWKSTRAPHGGTFLSGADTSFDVDRLGVGTNFAYDRADPLRPKNAGNFGLNARYNAESIESTIGLYLRKFDDYAPWVGLQLNNGARQFRFVYPKSVKLAGVSFARVIGPVSTGVELSYRKDAALNMPGTGVSLVDNEGPRGDTWHAVLNGAYLLPATSMWDTGSLAAELAYSRLDKVTSHPELFKGVGYNCVKTGTSNVVGDKTDGCSTRDYLAMALNFAPQYLNLFPSWNLDLPMSVSYGLHGNAPTGAGGFEKVMTWSVGGKLTFRQNHEFSLRYSDARASGKYNAAGTTLIGGNALGSALGATDRGWLVFTYKTGF